MRGKAAAQNANRRTSDALTQLEALKRQQKEDRDQYSAEVNSLKAEIAKLHSERQVDLARLVEARVGEVQAEVEKERGLSRAAVINFMWRKDVFIRNACKYISMTTGKHPFDVLPMVLTWALDKDHEGVGNLDHLCVELGVVTDGWTAARLKQLKGFEGDKRVSRGSTKAMTLDRAEAEGHPDIHPNYDPKWFPETHGDLKEQERPTHESLRAARKHDLYVPRVGRAS